MPEPGAKAFAPIVRLDPGLNLSALAYLLGQVRLHHGAVAQVVGEDRVDVGQGHGLVGVMDLLGRLALLEVGDQDVEGDAGAGHHEPAGQVANQRHRLGRDRLGSKRRTPPRIAQSAYRRPGSYCRRIQQAPPQAAAQPRVGYERHVM